ncbi:MAG: AAA family ATPase [Acidobacteria bacterium]|nr:AAA family ATPase [Acidobacteriota bacterium]
MASPHETSDVAPLPPVGRDREIALLGEHAEAAAGGAKRGVVLLGPPGIGKTTLLRLCHRLCEERGLAAAAVRVPTGAGLPPRYPIGEVLAALVSSCAALGIEIPDPLARAEEAFNRPRAGSRFPVALPQLADAFEAVGDLRPLAVLVDDYHSAPPEGAGLLLAALRAVETPLLFAATARDRVPCAGVEPAGDLWIDHVRLAGLRAEDVAAVAARELGGQTLPSLVDTLWERSRGNPLFVVEILREWRRDGLIERVGSFWGTTEEPAHLSPGSFGDIMRARIERLSAGTGDVANLVAVLGRDVSFEEIRATGGLEADRLAGALEELDRAGFLAVRAGPAYGLAHPTFSSALLARLAPTTLALIHQNAFRGLQALGRPVAATELAHHAVQALSPPPDLASLLSRAAEEAEALASYGEAARWYGHLAEHLRDDPGGMVEALIKRSEATAHFDPAAAVEDANRALLLATGRRQTARVLVTRAQARRALGDIDGAMEDVRAAPADLAGGDLFRARRLTAALHGIRGELDEAEKILVELGADPAAGRSLASPLGSLAFARGDVEGAITAWSRGVPDARSERENPDALHNLAWGLMVTGRWAEAAGLLDRGIRHAAAGGDAWRLVGFLANAARLEAWRGAFPLALDHFARARRLAPRLGNPTRVVDTLDALGVILLESGRFQEALSALTEAVALMETAAETQEAAFTVGLLAEAALRVGDLASARRWAEAAPGNRGLPLWLVIADRVTALCHVADGRPEAALQILDPWSERIRPIPFERGAVLTARAEALLAMRRMDDARASAREARAIFAALGAARRAEQADSLLAGMAPRPRGRPPKLLPSGLTPREEEVLQLLGEGLTNRQVARRLHLAERTVAKHVENMLTRTGLHKRTQLVALLLKRPPGGPAG